MDDSGRRGIKTVIKRVPDKGFIPFTVELYVETMADAEDLSNALGALHTPCSFNGNKNLLDELPCNIVRKEMAKQKNRR